jgi:hypothetical protein
MDINSGQPWSDMSVEDLKHAVKIGTPVREIATFLCRDVEEVLAKVDELDAAGLIEIPDAGWRYTIEDAVSAQITSWNGGHVGVEHIYPNGHCEAHQVGSEDWPVIRKLIDTGKLSYASEEVREGMAEIFKLGLDR